MISGLARAAAVLRGRVEGQVLLPGEDGYDAARTVWNAMVDRRPALVVRCAGAGDVVAGVRSARELGVELGVRCGGHSAVGHAVPEGGLMLDLTPMGTARVDPRNRRAWVQGGALLGPLDRACQQHGLATTAGNVSHTGVGGLALGGGMGWLARRYGLTCDNLVAGTVVTAGGDVVRATAAEHPELFWALRGGGGNFGVVTEFEFRVHPTGTAATSVELDFPLDRAVEVLRGWRDLSAAAPRQATCTADLADGRLVVGYVWVGDHDGGRALLRSFAALGRPLQRRVVDSSYLRLQTRNDSAQGHALRRYARGHYVRELGDRMIGAMVAGLESGPLVPSVGLQAYGGAIADVPDHATAFSHRDALFELSAGFGWTDPAEDAARVAAARAYGAALEPFASGAYVNALGDEGAGGVRRAYPPEKLTRLAAVKAAWDPDNVFALNANIRPVLAGAAHEHEERNPMRKIVNSTFISLDGVMEQMVTWHFAYLSDSTTALVTEMIRRCDAALMGRLTYEAYAATWPQETGEFADRLNTIQKYVASTTLETAEWTNSTIVKGDLVEFVTDLKAQPGGDILMNGIGPVARTLLRHGLLDELHLWVHPVLAATGGPDDLLFRVGDPTHLQLTGTTTLDKGVVVLSYRAEGPLAGPSIDAGS